MTSDDAIAEDSDLEITLSTKKNFLRKELQRDPRLKDIFSELAQEGKQPKGKGCGKSKEGSQCTMNNNKQINPSQINQRMPGLIVKSPSESTLYIPALKKVADRNVANNVIDKISNFVESIRMDSFNEETPVRDESPMMDQDEPQPLPGPSGYIQRKDKNDQGKTGAIPKANTNVIDAEKLKASLLAPQGMLPIKIDHNIELLRNLDSDDDFFHVTCHIDENLKTKIQRGEYVDLE